MLYLIIFKLAYVLQVALYAQPDAKVANGVYWTEFWLHIAEKILL